MKNITQLLFLVFYFTSFSSHASEAVTPLPELIKTGQYDKARQQAKNNKHYLHTLIKQANDKKLYENNKWHMLVHYKGNIFGDYTSEVDGEDFFSDFFIGQVNEEYFVESAFTQKLGRKSSNVIGCSYDKYRRLVLLKPRQECAEHSL